MNRGESLFSAKGWVVFIFALFLASGMCAVIIALGVDFLGIVPFGFLAHTIFLNNFWMSLLIAPLLFRALSKRIRQMQLSYDQLLPESDFSGAKLRALGPFLLLVALLLTYGLMMFAPPSNLKIFEPAAVLILTLLALLLL
ncbi:MAG TPA: hypothetical protein VI958_03865, partial [Acidobacteriota bacterium]